MWHFEKEVIRLHALILAGGKGKRLSAGQPKALVDLAGKPLWRYSYEAAMRLKQTSSLSIIVPSGCTLGLVDIQCFETTSKYLTDIINALEVLPRTEEILLLNADAVLITNESLEAFLELAKSYKDAAIVWPQIRRQAFGPEYESMIFHSLLGNKTVATGNAILVRPSLINFKTVLGLAKGISLGKVRNCGLATFFVALLQAFTYGVPITQAETLFSRLIGAKVRLPLCDIPELGFDVDFPEEFSLAEKILSTKPSVY